MHTLTNMIALSVVLVGVWFCHAKPTTHPTTVPANWKTIDTKKVFTFSAPEDLTEQRGQGIDLYFGRDLGLTFNYGPHPKGLEKMAAKKEATSRRETINGREATIVAVDKQVGIYFDKTSDDKDNKNKLVLIVTLNTGTQEDAMMLIRSIAFLPEGGKGQ